MNWLLVIAGAALGAPLRYLTDRPSRRRHDTVFPWGTFTVNVAGCLVLGLVTGAAAAGAAPDQVRLLLGTGLCGALTTYSTFSYETLRLAEEGAGLFAAANAAGSVVAGLGAAFAGAASPQRCERARPGAGGAPEAPGPAMRPWRFVVAFGTISLLADFVYEGARSVTGPLLGSLGASALVVGVVTGAGEAAALGLRLVSGPLADRWGRLWAWTIAGYVLTVVSVPVLGVAGVLWAACVLVVAERVGKAVRSPAKDALLAYATAATGRGRGFAVHEAMDQVGALVGPLTVAGVLAVTGGDYGPALGVLALPGIAVVGVLLWLRLRVPDPSGYEVGAAAGPASAWRPQAGTGARDGRTAAAGLLDLCGVHRRRP